MPRPESDPFALLESDPTWKEHWEGMPEFIQKDLQPVKSITVNFEKPEDVAAFAKLLGQTVTMDTRSIWYPAAAIGRLVTKRFVDVSEDGK